MKAVSILVLALVLASCATTAPIVPATLLECEHQPKSPANSPGATERDAALYIVRLAEAGADCRDKLGSVRRLLTETE